MLTRTSRSNRTPARSSENASPSPAPTEAPAKVELCGSVRAALAEVGRGPNKALGQHFLAQPAIARKIASVADVSGKRTVEIGPGLGALTQFLLDAQGLWLIELDHVLANRLQRLLRDFRHVTTVQADALAIDWRKFLQDKAPVTVVGNLPYNVATPLLSSLLEVADCLERVVAMVQHEVAERLHAEPRTASYSALSVLTQAGATVRKAFVVAPGAFVPPPKVHSQVVVLEPAPERVAQIADWDVFRRLVRTVFRQRRKQLRNSLTQVVAAPAEILRLAGVEPTCRPEELGVDEFCHLANVIVQYARTS